MYMYKQSYPWLCAIRKVRFWNLWSNPFLSINHQESHYAGCIMSHSIQYRTNTYPQPRYAIVLVSCIKSILIRWNSDLVGFIVDFYVKYTSKTTLYIIWLQGTCILVPYRDVHCQGNLFNGKGFELVW